MGCWPRARFHCHGVLALRDRPLSGALLAVQEGGRMEGLRLVSRQFRKHTAGLIRTSLPWYGSARPPGAELCWVQEGGRMEGLRLVSRQFRKQRLALPAAGPMGCWPRARSALHCHGDMCFGSARLAFERSFAGSAGRRANGRSETSF